VANANVAKFKQAWERMVGIVRGIIPGIWFDFSPNPDHVRGTSPQVFVDGFAPNPTSWNVLSCSHHDNWLSSSNPTVNRNVPSTWTRHQTYLDSNYNYAVSVGKKFALTEWATQLAEENPPSIYFPIATDPEWYLQKTWDWLYPKRANIAWDCYFSVSTTKLYDRTTPQKAVDAKNTFKTLWT
jgi:hypothetical protein